jgi:methionine-rich copper-binding protein CopC/putative copper export protein/ABC-type branched-subunit amino acid transport system substrate-binding protein
MGPVRDSRINARRWPKATAVAVSALCWFLVAVPSASAHPYLIASSPQAGVVASQAPSHIQIAFTEGLVISGCSVTITKQGGGHVKVGTLKPTLGGSAMTATLPTMPEGVYTVNWVAYGADGHTVEGSYKFGVPNTNGQPPPGAATLLSSTTTTGESAPTESLVSVAGRWVASVAAFALLAAAVLFWRLSGRLSDELFEDARRRWLRIAPGALALALIGTLAEFLERAHGPHGFNFGLLTAATAGISIIVRLAVLAIATLAMIVGARLAVGPRRRLALSSLAGAVTLAMVALDGHVSTVKVTPWLAAIGMVAHLLSAGLWMGAIMVIALTLVPLAKRTGNPEPLWVSVRSYAPIAIGAAVVTAVTGVIAAVREVHRWYFLRWSAYGHILIIKVVIVAAIVAVGAAAALLAHRRGASARRVVILVRSEAVLAVVAIAVAALLAGTLQGAGQSLPSQRGNLLPGAGFADVAVASGAVGQVTLAPAEVGINHIIVDDVSPNQTGYVPPKAPRSIQVALACACGGANLSLKATLHPGSGGPSGPWVASVGLPLDGNYTAELIENGAPTVGEPEFTVGDLKTPGSTPVEIASVADLSGPHGAECRSQELGALVSIELMNASGGLGGNKLHQVLLDDGGSAAVARSDALELAKQHPVAFLDPCGEGAQAAIAAVGNRIPTIVSDDSVPVTNGRYVYRLAPNPRAEGYAIGEYIGAVGAPSEPKAPRRVAAFVGNTAGGAQRLAGLRAALEHYHVALRVYPASGPKLIQNLTSVLPQLRWLGIYADGNFNTLTTALRTIGNDFKEKFEPSPIIVPQSLASESFIIDSGLLGAQGQIRVVSDVDPTANDAQLYAELVPQVVGELATVPGLEGFVSGQALAHGLIKGGSVSEVSAQLRSPGVFSTIATSPWDPSDPASGTLIFRVLLAEFLTDNLIPSVNGGPAEPYEGDFFTDGSWEQATPELFSPLKLGAAADSPFGP